MELCSTAAAHTDELTQMPAPEFMQSGPAPPRTAESAEPKKKGNTQKTHREVGLYPKQPQEGSKGLLLLHRENTAGCLLSAGRDTKKGEGDGGGGGGDEGYEGN